MNTFKSQLLVKFLMFFCFVFMAFSIVGCSGNRTPSFEEAQYQQFEADKKAAAAEYKQELLEAEALANSPEVLLANKKAKLFKAAKDLLSKEEGYRQWIYKDPGVKSNGSGCAYAIGIGHCMVYNNKPTMSHRKWRSLGIKESLRAVLAKKVKLSHKSVSILFKYDFDNSIKSINTVIGNSIFNDYSVEKQVIPVAMFFQFGQTKMNKYSNTKGKFKADKFHHVGWILRNRFAKGIIKKRMIRLANLATRAHKNALIAKNTATF